MGKAFYQDSDKVQGYAKDAMVSVSTLVVAPSVTFHCCSSYVKDFSAAFLCAALLVHGAGGVPNQAGLVLGSGAGSGGGKGGQVLT